MNKKIKINGNKHILHNKIKAKLGLTDKKNQNVFYLEGGTFVIPNVEYDDFQQIMKDVESSCKKTMKRKLFNNKLFESNFLMNFEICSNRMKKGKSSYLSFQYHFKQKNNNNDSIVTLKQNNEEFFTELLSDIECNITNYNMNISKTRKN